MRHVRTALLAALLLGFTLSLSGCFILDIGSHAPAHAVSRQAK